MSNGNKDPEILQKEIISIIAERLGMPAANITTDAYLFEDLNASLLEKADIFQTLEEKYHLKFASSDIKTLKTVGNIVEFITDNAD